MSKLLSALKPIPAGGVRGEQKPASPSPSPTLETARRILGDQRLGVQVLPKNGLLKGLGN